MPNLHSTKILGDLRVTGLTKLNEVDAFTLNGQLTSTVATGTAPFVVASTTPVTNLGVYWPNVANKPDPVVTVTLTGDVTGSGNTTLTDLASGTISFATTIAANSVALGTDTTGNYVVGLTGGTGISIAGTAGEGWTPTINHTNSITANTTGVGETTKSLAFSGTFKVPSVLKYDTEGHITGVTDGNIYIA